MIRRGVHKSVQALEADIRTWIAGWNENPKPLPGPRPPKRSSTHWQDISSGFPAGRTSAVGHLPLGARPAARELRWGARRPLPAVIVLIVEFHHDHSAAAYEGGCGPGVPGAAAPGREGSARSAQERGRRHLAEDETGRARSPGRGHAAKRYRRPAWFELHDRASR
jgi:hypothetical protein